MTTFQERNGPAANESGLNAPAGSVRLPWAGDIDGAQVMLAGGVAPIGRRAGAGSIVVFWMLVLG